MNLTAPYININGNSANDLKDQFYKIYKALQAAADTIQATDYHNGRNATDQNHAQQMKAEKGAILDNLNTLQDQYLELYKIAAKED